MGVVNTVVACTEAGGTRLEQRPIPEPDTGEILLKLRVCGLCGTDLFKLANATEPPGTVLGHEIVGTVVERGGDVDLFEVGDRIVVPHHVACGTCALCRRGSDTMCPVFKENLLEPGGLAHFVLVGRRATQQAAHRVPEHISDGAASFLEPSACVLRGIDKAELPDAGGCAVIVGAGTMGLLHLLVLQATRPELKTMVVDPMADRQDFASRLGANAACGTDMTELRSTIEQLSSGVGADAVFDTVGGSGPARSGLELIRPGGTIVLFAHAGEGELAGFELNPFFKSEGRLIATYSGGIKEQREVARLLFEGDFDPTPLISHRFPLSRFPEAVRLATQRKAYKIMLEADVS